MQPRRREIHVIVDNLSAHKTKAVSAFLETHPRLHLHFTPTYASWLNQVELWFGKIEREFANADVSTIADHDVVEDVHADQPAGVREPLA